MHDGDSKLSIDPAPAPARRSGEPDPVAIAALICIVLGWFVLTAIETRLAGLRLTFHFYDMWSVLQHPSRLVTGLKDDDRLTSILFGAVCFAVVIGALLAPSRPGRPSGLLPYFAPLALMRACSILLYQRAAADFFTNASPPDRIRWRLTALANTLANRVSRSISRHVTPAIGAYLSLAASIVLAIRGASRFRPGSRAGASASQSLEGDPPPLA